MTVSNTVWAMEQALPAHPKFLLVTLTDCAGMSEFFDLRLESYRHKCGMSDAEIEAALYDLEDFGALKVVNKLDDGWRIRFTYPGEYSEPTEYRPRRAAAPVKSVPGWLYIIGTSHGVTKVGITTDLPGRVKSIVTNAGIDAQLDWSFACDMARARELEQAILQHFASDRFKGEWMRRPATDVIAVAKHLTAPPDGVNSA